MRKFLILAAAAGSALAVATPAAAQYYPQPYNNGYAYNGYGNNGYGYNGYNNYAGNLRFRIDRLQQRISMLDRRDLISNRDAWALRAQTNELQRQLRYPGQGYNVERRLAQLEQRVAYIGGRNRYGQYNDYRDNQWNGDRNWNRDDGNWNRGDRNWRDRDDDDDNDD